MTTSGRIELTSYRVIYGDTDQMGVVYYANYLRWFEIGRTEWLRAIGSPYRKIEQMGLRFPVTHVSCYYRRPAHYDDELIIETGLATLGRVSLVFRYRVYRSGDQMLLAEGETQHACVNETGEITRIPPPLTAAVANL